MWVKDYQKQQKVFNHRTRAMWITYKYSFSHLVKRCDFDVIIDHLAPTHIIKSKGEPATVRIKGLFDLISSYSFNLYYIKWERHGIQ